MRAARFHLEAVLQLASYEPTYWAELERAHVAAICPRSQGSESRQAVRQPASTSGRQLSNEAPTVSERHLGLVSNIQN